MCAIHLTRIRILALLIVSVFFAACAYHSADEGTPDTNPNISWTAQGLKVLGCNGGPDCQVYDACVKGGSVICDKGHCTGINNTRADFQCVIDVYYEYSYAPPTTPTAAPAPSTPAPVNSCSPGTGRSCPCTDGTMKTQICKADGISYDVCQCLTASTAPPVVTPAPIVQTGFCGKVSAPPEQVAQAYDRSYCHYVESIRPDETTPKPWIAAVADKGGTIEIISFTLYGILPNGLSFPIAGDGIGKPGITWAGTWHRQPWFVPSNLVGTVAISPTKTYTVPAGSLVLHLGNEGANRAGYVDFYVVLKVKTTGDAKIIIGIDVYNGNVDEHEMSMSNWAECTTGTVTISTSNKFAPSACDGTVYGLCGATPEVCDGKDNDCDGLIDEDGVCNIAPPPPPAPTPVPAPAPAPAPAPVPAPAPPPPSPSNNGCPSQGTRVTVSASALAACPSIQVVTFGPSGTPEIDSQPGQPLSVPQASSWYGVLYHETKCGSVWQSVWPAASSTATSAGFSQVCSRGVDITATTPVCDTQWGRKIAVALNPTESTGRCP